MDSKTRLMPYSQYLETHGEIQDGRLPEWSEFQELAAEYEINR